MTINCSGSLVHFHEAVSARLHRVDGDINDPLLFAPVRFIRKLVCTKYTATVPQGVCHVWYQLASQMRIRQPDMKQIGLRGNGHPGSANPQLEVLVYRTRNVKNITSVSDKMTNDTWLLFQVHNGDWNQPITALPSCASNLSLVL